MNDSADLITRREALRRAAYVLGGALSAPTVMGALAGCEASSRKAGNGASKETWTPQTLSAEQDELVLAMGEHILPETDTPGARAARVNEYIDAMLTDFYPEEQRRSFLDGLDRVDVHAQRRFDGRFLDISPEQQLELVEVLNRTAFLQQERHQEETPPEGQDAELGREGNVSVGTERTMPNFGEDDRGRNSFFATFKELVVVGFYTSEVGATEELRVNPMGAWQADISYTEVGQAWA